MSSGSMSSESMSMSESTSMSSMSSGSMSSESMSMSESTSSSSSTDSSESSSSSSMTSSSSSEETAEDSTEVSSSSSETMSSSMSDSMSSGSMTMSSDVASAPVGSESNIETGESSDEEMVSSGALPAFTIVCPADVSVTTTCGGQVAEVSVPGATSNDPNVQITNSKYPQFDTTLNNLSGNYPLGTHTVGYTGHAEGLGQASCTFTITISAGECTETPVTSTPCFVGETACCSDQGVWESDNTCTCDEGFVGDACMGMATASMQINLDGPVDTDAFINAIADALDIDASRVQVVSSGDDQITLAIESDGAEEGSTAIEELGDALEGGNDAFADFGVTGFNTFSATGEPETTVNYTASTPRGTLSVPWWVFVAIGVVVIIAIVIIVVVVKRGSRGKAIKKNSNFGDDMKMQLEHAYDDEEDFHPI